MWWARQATVSETRNECMIVVSNLQKIASGKTKDKVAGLQEDWFVGSGKWQSLDCSTVILWYAY